MSVTNFKWQWYLLFLTFSARSFHWSTSTRRSASFRDSTAPTFYSLSYRNPQRNWRIRRGTGKILKRFQANSLNWWKPRFFPKIFKYFHKYILLIIYSIRQLSIKMKFSERIFSSKISIICLPYLLEWTQHIVLHRGNSIANFTSLKG